MLMKKKFILDVNPSNGEIIEKIKCSSTAEIASALKLAKKAFKTWSDTPLKNKLIVFRKILRDLEKDKKEIARIISSEVGKSFESALNEIESSISLIEVNCLISSDILNNINNREGNIITEIVREPIGVCALITTWNNPLKMPVSILTPAILSGNTIIYKPSEYAPISGKKIFEIYNRSLPRGVINIVQGVEEVSDVLINSDINFISFSGRKEIGKKIMSSACNKLMKVISEINGKYSMIVLNDSNLKKAASYAAESCFRNLDNLSCSPDRIFVEDKCISKFEDYLISESKKYKINGSNKIDINPIINDESRNHIFQQIEEAKKRGVKVLSGGIKSNAKGFFIEPTILSGVTDKHNFINSDYNIPVVRIQKVKSKDEAVEKANNFSLKSGVTIWTSNISKAVDIAKKLDIEKIGINQGFRSNNHTIKTSNLAEIEKNEFIERFKVFTRQKRITYNKI